MTDAIAVAVIGGFGTIITGLLSYLSVVSTGTRRHAKAARNEVQNTHTVNLRDDLDAKFKGLDAQLCTVIDRQNTVIEKQASQGKDIGGIRADVRHLAESDLEQAKAARENRQQINALQEQIPRQTPQQPKEH